MLTQEKLKTLLDYDPTTGRFLWKSSVGGQITGAIAGTLYNTGYIRIQIGRSRYLAHRLAWLYVYGEWPKNQIDHINKIRTDNAIANLRVVSHVENLWNKTKYKSNTSGFTGVAWHKRHNLWQARIQVKRVMRHLGYFTTPEEAHIAYLAAKSNSHIIGECDERRTD